MVPCSLLWNLIILGHLWPFFWFVFALIFLLCLHHFLACCLCDCQTPTEPFKMAAIILPFHLQGFISDYFKWIIAFLTTNHWFSFSINFLLIFHYFSIINNFCSLCRNLLVFLIKEYSTILEFLVWKILEKLSHCGQPKVVLPLFLYP